MRLKAACQDATLYSTDDIQVFEMNFSSCPKTYSTEDILLVCKHSWRTLIAMWQSKCNARDALKSTIRGAIHHIQSKCMPRTTFENAIKHCYKWEVLGRLEPDFLCWARCELEHQTALLSVPLCQWHADLALLKLTQFPLLTCWHRH